MYHSITFVSESGTQVNTWGDWHLIPTSRPTVALPEFESKSVEVPGMNGSLDLSTALTGKPVFKNRNGTFEFHVANGYDDWYILYSKIANFLHGKKFKVILEDDDAYYYEGRLTFDIWQPSENNSSVTFGYDLKPYKYERISSIEDWLWDPFDFRYGAIRDYRNLEVDGTLEVVIEAISEEPSKPIIHVESITSDTLLVKHPTLPSSGVELHEGVNVIRNLELVRRSNGDSKPLVFVGTGVISIEYRGTSL